MYANETAVMTEPVVEVETGGEVSPRDIARARRLIGYLLRRYRVSGLARVRLTGGAARDGMTVAQVNLRAGGVALRTEVDGPGGFALTFAAERLAGQLERLSGDTPPRWAPDPGRAPLVSVTEDRPIVRRKPAAALICDPATAVARMDEMDYDAFLFTDSETGEDAIVYWAGPRGVRLARQHRMRPPRGMRNLPLTVNPYPTRTCTESAAVNRLCCFGLPFLFYTDTGDGRGRLLYRRFDGDLGLVIATGPSAGKEVGE